MNTILLLVIITVSSSIVFVNSQKSCSTSDDCEKDECCSQKECYDGIFCTLLRTKQQLQRCYADSNCIDGCCVKNKCQPKSSNQCIHKRCDSNLDCTSYCCKNGECQKTDFECLTVPTMNMDFLDKCSSNSDCYSPTKSCCVDKKCQACTNDPPYYYGNNGGSTDGSSRSGGGMSVGASVGIGFLVVLLFIAKIAFCVSRCSRIYRRIRVAMIQRRMRVAMIRRQTRVAVAPIVEQEEQQEHRRSPPPYSPQADHHVNSSSREQGVSQETPTEPPPEYTSISMDNPIEKNDINSYEGTPGNGGTDEMNGVPQGETMLPTPSSISPNNADENSK